MLITNNKLRYTVLLALVVYVIVFPSMGLAENHPSSEQSFIDGKKLYDSGRLEAALPVWKPIAKDDLYGPVVYLLTASKYMSSRQYSMAESSIIEFLKIHPSTPYREMALVILIDAQVEQGKKDVAKTIVGQLDKAEEFEKPGLIHKLASLDLKSGSYEAAAKRLRKLSVDYPASVEGLRAWEQLSDLASQHKIPAVRLTESEEQTRSEKLFHAGKFDLAAESYKRLHLAKPEEKNIKFKLARCLYKNRDNQEAIKMANNFLNSKVTPEEQAEANYLLSLIYWRLDREKEFEASCKKVLEKGSPKFKRRVNANLAAHHFEKGALSKAEIYYNKLFSETTDSVVKADIKWKLAWIKYRTQRFKEAALLFAESRKLSTNGKLVNPSKYWEARSLAQAGSNTAAETLFRELLPARRNDYYAIEAAKVLGVNDIPVRQASASRNISADMQLTQPQQNIKEVKYAMVLLEKDLPEFALANLRALPKAVRQTPSITLLTAMAAQNTGFYGMAHDVLYSQFGALVDEPPDSSPLEFLNLAYPKAHFPHTIRQAAAHGVDPYLVWSIMRQESRYDSAAVSPAGAIGLMQVTPDTARKLNSFRQRGNSMLIADLLDPRVNISTGVEILAQNIKAFGGNLVATIAAYNADPKKVRDWVKRNGKMKQDEFIENIPFLETRLYVKKVLSNLATYKRIHTRSDMVERW